MSKGTQQCFVNIRYLFVIAVLIERAHAKPTAAAGLHPDKLIQQTQNKLDSTLLINKHIGTYLPFTSFVSWLYNKLLWCSIHLPELWAENTGKYIECLQEYSPTISDPDATWQ